jgi:hypothetical protein
MADKRKQENDKLIIRIHDYNYKYKQDKIRYTEVTELQQFMNNRTKNKNNICMYQK